VFQHILLSPKRIRVSVSPQHNTVEYATTNDATTKECYNERKLQRTVFINNIGMLQQTMLERKNATTNSFYQ
jgi:hypothetical protein